MWVVEGKLLPVYPAIKLSRNEGIVQNGSIICVQQMKKYEGV